MRNRFFMCLIAAMAIAPQWGSAQSVALDAPLANDALRKSLASASLTIATKADGTNAAQDFVAAARADYRRLLTALYDQGYFSGVISITIDGQEAAAISPLDTPAEISRIILRVTPGPKFQLGQAVIAPLHPTTQLPDGFAKGRSASTSVIKEAVNDVVEGWRANGHAKAEPQSQKITARHRNNLLDVNVAIAPGPKLQFGQLSVSGNQDVRANRIKKIAGLPVGETYDPIAIDAALTRLRRTGAFNSVSFSEADDIGPNASLPVSIAVVESKQRRFGFGAELSTIEGFGLSGYWLHRNFRGGAERLLVEADISGIGGETGGTDYSIGASFDRPAIYGAATDLFIRTEISRLDEPEYLLDKASFEIGATRIIGKDILGELGIGLLNAREENLAFSRNYSLFTLPFEATLEKRDNVTNPKDGYYLQTSISPFISFDGDDAGVRSYADARVFRSFGQDEKITIAARAQVGAVFGADVQNTPADYLFYSGGGSTVRGQEYDSLGVTSVINGTQVRTGGRSYIGAQVEARYRVSEAFGLVGFYDFGQVGDTSGFTDGTSSHAGTGIGLRYDTGIGPIRFDVGTPADGAAAFDNVQVYIGIGQAF